MIDKSWMEKSGEMFLPQALSEFVYLKGAENFMKRAIEELEKHKEKVEIDDEFEDYKMKAYLQAIKNAIEIIKKIKAK